MDFDKQAKTIDQQRELLISRGLDISDTVRADNYLSHTNYYRLSAYFIPYQHESGSHQFLAGASLDRVLLDYEFDRSFRMLLMGALERIEVSMRTQWAYHMGLKFGSHGYTMWHKRVYKNENLLRRDLAKLHEQVRQSNEPFIKHLKGKYSDELPPCWAACEVMSFGLLSKMYSNLSAYSVRKQISAVYDLEHPFLEGAMGHLSYVRNVCAHHSRLWNKHLIKKMPLPRSNPLGFRDSLVINDLRHNGHKVYNTLVLIQHLLIKIHPESDWADQLIALLREYDMDVTAMGFPSDWQKRSIWAAYIDGIRTP